MHVATCQGRAPGSHSKGCQCSPVRPRLPITLPSQDLPSPTLFPPRTSSGASPRCSFAGPGNFIAHIYYSLLFPKYILCDACSAVKWFSPLFSMELLQNLLLAEGGGQSSSGKPLWWRERHGSLAHLCRPWSGKERLSKGSQGGSLVHFGKLKLKLLGVYPAKSPG